MLQDVGWCLIKFENGQIFVATFLDVARCCVRLASPFTTSHNTDPTMLQNVAFKSVLRAFGRALTQLSN